MYRLMAAYPAEKITRTTPNRMKASGTPRTPVTPYIVVTPLARTVSGAEAAIVIKVMEATPSFPRVLVVVTVSVRVAVIGILISEGTAKRYG